MSNFFENKTMEIEKETFQQMNDLLLQFEEALRESLAKNKELTSRCNDLESLMKNRDKAPDTSEALNRYKKLLKDASNV